MRSAVGRRRAMSSAFVCIKSLRIGLHHWNHFCLHAVEVAELGSMTRFRRGAVKLLLHLNAESCSFILENYGNRIDDSHSRICLAIQNDLVFGFSCLRVIQEMFLSETIIP